MTEKTIFLSSGKVLIPGKVKGPVLLSSLPLSFSRLEAQSGVITDRRVDVFGQTIRGKILVFPSHRGSTTSPAVFLETCRQKAGPLAILVLKSDPLLFFSALLAKELYGMTIPVIEGIDKRIFNRLEPNTFLKVDGYEGRILKIL
jgi:predicted aconitase with swiveling domain